MLRFLLCSLALVAPVHALASSVGGEVAVGSVDVPSADESGTQRATYVAAGLSGSIDLVRDTLLLDLDLISLKDNGSAVSFQGAVGLAWFLSDHWNLDLLATFSPKRESTYEERISTDFLRDRGRLPPRLTGVSGSVPATFHVNDGSTGLALAAGFDTFGESWLETAVDAMVGLTRYSITQQVVVHKLLQDIALAPSEDVLNQLRLGLTLTETLWLDTDVQLHFSWFLYSKPPSEFGAYLWVPALGGAVPAGTGSPIAPLRWELRPMVAHRFGRLLSVALQVGQGAYLEGGTTRLAALKLKLKPTSNLRISANLLLQRDAGLPDMSALTSRYLGLGATWYFD